MRSSGGVATLEEAAAHPSWILVSGPAGGVVGAALVARLAGFPNAISFDMGGTSTDVCLVRRRPRRALDGAARRRAPDPASQRRPPHGRRRRRLDRLDRRRRGAPCRAGKRRRPPGPGLLRAGRYAADRHRREPPARAASRRASGRHRARPRGGASARWAGSIRRRWWRSSTPRCCARCGSSRSSAVTTRATSRSSHSAAPGRSTPARWPSSSGIGHGARAARRRRAVGARARRERRAARPRALLRSSARPRRGSCRATGEADLRYRGQSFELTVALGRRSRGPRFHQRARGALRLRAARPPDRARRRPHGGGAGRAQPSTLPAGEALVVTGPAVVELEGATCWIPPGWVGVRDGNSTLVLTRA